MRRRISSAVGASVSKETIASVTLGAYMAAICSASRSVASLMTAEEDPFSGLPLTIELVAFLLVWPAPSIPSVHHEGTERILPVAKLPQNSQSVEKRCASPPRAACAMFTVSTSSTAWRRRPRNAPRRRGLPPRRRPLARSRRRWCPRPSAPCGPRPARRSPSGCCRRP
jgi:hypothetical protein